MCPCSIVIVVSLPLCHRCSLSLSLSRSLACYCWIEEGSHDSGGVEGRMEDCNKYPVWTSLPTRSARDLRYCICKIYRVAD
ncbi:hypothetical protein Syun_009698 [Stephania yunnanensis]|uniref:Secreted protein n=1 Tax=Stephania yunnanensis TaxID=152371 RepID=A0AAP0PQW9_9MAGN